MNKELFIDTISPKLLDLIKDITDDGDILSDKKLLRIVLNSKKWIMNTILKWRRIAAKMLSI